MGTSLYLYMLRRLPWPWCLDSSSGSLSRKYADDISMNKKIVASPIACSDNPERLGIALGISERRDGRIVHVT